MYASKLSSVQMDGVQDVDVARGVCELCFHKIISFVISNGMMHHNAINLL